MPLTEILEIGQNIWVERTAFKDKPENLDCKIRKNSFQI